MPQLLPAGTCVVRFVFHAVQCVLCWSLFLMFQLVGRVSGFIFVSPHPVFFGTSLVLPPTSHRFISLVFFVLPPPHRFSFASPSHTTKKILTDRNFPCWCKLFLVMSLCERINHDQSLNIKSKLINLTLNCSITLIRKQNNRF